MSTPTRPSGRRWLGLALIAAAQFVVIMDTSIIGVALPDIQRELGFTAESLSWVFNAYVVAFGGLLLLGGRLSDVFDAYSTPEGTVVLACVGAKTPGNVSAFDIGGVSVIKDGEAVCGDAWAVHEDDAGMTVLVADGLGHGPGASEAARAAVNVPADWNGDASCAGVLDRSVACARACVTGAASIAAPMTKARQTRIIAASEPPRRMNARQQARSNSLPRCPPAPRRSSVGSPGSAPRRKR